MNTASHRCLTAISALLIAGPAMAQAGDDDWDLRVNPQADLIAASLTFDSGVAVGVRCFGGRYDALLAGLPAARERVYTRDLTIQFGDEAPGAERWNVAVDRQVAVSSLPARFARSLRQGGRMQVVLRGAGANGSNIRYVFDLPASSSAIDQTLEACDKPLIDPRDAEIEGIGEDGLPAGFRWAERPRPSWPNAPETSSGFAVISCLTQPDGRLRDCTVESQHPLDGGYGDAALRATRRARVQITDNPDAPIPTRFVTYRTNFYPRDPDLAPTGTRLRRD